MMWGKRFSSLLGPFVVWQNEVVQQPTFLPFNLLFPAYQFLEKNFIGKKVVSPPMPKNPKYAKRSSIALVCLLRWNLPFSKIPFSAEDGSAEVGAVGGINFHPRKAGGYRPNAGFDIEVGETQLNHALSERLVFFENHFSGLIF